MQNDILNPYAFVVIVIMLSAGIIGSSCRQVFDKRLKTASISEIVVPGIVASFAIPIFLSIGKSNVFEEILQGQKFWANCFIIFLFCSLAGVSARNFVSAVSKQLLQTAEQADKKANNALSELDSVKDDLAEAKENILANNSAPSNAFGVQKLKLPDDLTAEEKAVMGALVNGDYSLRAVSGIARDAKLKERSNVRAVLQSLIGKGLAKEVPSKTGGRTLYQATLTPTHPA